MEGSQKQNLSQAQQIVTIVLTVIAVAAIAASVYFYMQYSQTKKFVNNPGLASQLEVKAVTAQVGKLMVLPTGEDPTVATVTDVTKLKGQPFFAGAQNGDKVLLYVKAQKAILYSVKMNKILNVQPLNIQANAVPAIKIDVYNGSGNPANTDKLTNDLKTKTNNTQVGATQQAASTYGQTIVVDLKGTQSQAASQLAQFVNGTVGQLPANEPKPTDGADLLVILGSNYAGTAAVPTVAPTAAATNEAGTPIPTALAPTK